MRNLSGVYQQIPKTSGRRYRYRKRHRGGLPLALRDHRQFESVERSPGAPGSDRKRQIQFRKRIEAFTRLSRSLTTTLEELVTTTEMLDSANPLAVEFGIDFYAEIRRFEIVLIKRALRHTRGSQIRAAALLSLNAQTLNTKIKQYEIKARDYKRTRNMLSLIQ
jgi:hypothetical protein